MPEAKKDFHQDKRTNAIYVQKKPLLSNSKKSFMIFSMISDILI